MSLFALCSNYCAEMPGHISRTRVCLNGGGGGSGGSVLCQKGGEGAKMDIIAARGGPKFMLLTYSVFFSMNTCINECSNHPTSSALQVYPNKCFFYCLFCRRQLSVKERVLTPVLLLGSRDQCTVCICIVFTVVLLLEFQFFGSVFIEPGTSQKSQTGSGSKLFPNTS